MGHIFAPILIGLLLLLPSCWQQDKNLSSNAAQEEESITVVQEEATKNIASDQGKTPQNLEDLIDDKEKAAAFLKERIAQGKTIIDFYATWCPPCKMMSPILDEIAQEHPDIAIIKVNIDKFVDLSNDFNITGQKLIVEGVPTFHLFKDGKFAGTIDGGMRKEAFVEQINYYFNN